MHFFGFTGKVKATTMEHHKGKKLENSEFGAIWEIIAVKNPISPPKGDPHCEQAQSSHFFPDLPQRVIPAIRVYKGQEGISETVARPSWRWMEMSPIVKSSPVSSPPHLSPPSIGSQPGCLPGWELLAASQCLVLGID